jgi:RNase adapter protein RapZ
MSAARPRPRLLLVTGMSGAGKSTVLDALEDMGWDCVDNLPVLMLPAFIAASHPVAAPLAVGMDVRSRGFDPDETPKAVRDLKGATPEILYLDCAGSELVRRYGETRRRHPLAPDRPAEDGIARERELTATLRNTADTVIDTTDMTPAELRQELQRRYAPQSDQPVLTITSFGFSRGVARTADMLFDMRFIDNPHWIPDLRGLTGLEQAVADHCGKDPAWEPTLARIEALLLDLIPRYWQAGKSYLTVAFGCTGGRHRSVAAAEAMAARLRAAGYSLNVRHRDLASAPSDTIEGPSSAQAAGDGQLGG